MRLSHTIPFHTSWKHHREFTNITKSDNNVVILVRDLKVYYSYIPTHPFCVGIVMSARLVCITA